MLNLIENTSSQKEIRKKLKSQLIQINNESIEMLIIIENIQSKKEIRKGLKSKLIKINK